MRISEEQRELGAVVRAVLAGSGEDRAGAARLLAEQVGAYGLTVPEQYGGAGFGLPEACVVLEELGRTLTPVAYLGTAVLAPAALLAAGDQEAAARLLPGLAEGTRTAALGWAERGSWEAGAMSTAAERGTAGRAGWRLSGVKEHVLDGAEADLLLVLARTPRGLSLFESAPTAPGVAVEPLTAVDPSRPQARLRLDRAEAALIGAEGAGEEVLARLRDTACAALAAEQVGGAAYCLEATVEYALTRVQFGRAIGSFQAVKHRLADLFVQVEAARSAAMGAAREPARLGAVARSVCSEAFTAAAGEMIQLHGGIGITWEHPAHRYFKRAYGSAELFGAPALHRTRLARELIDAQ